MSMEDTDKGLDEIRSEIEKFKHLAVKCGITESADGEVIKYAAYNEYGTAKIPACPFVSGWADNKRDPVRKKRRHNNLGNKTIRGSKREEMELRLTSALGTCLHPMQGGRIMINECRHIKDAVYDLDRSGSH